MGGNKAIYEARKAAGLCTNCGNAAELHDDGTPMTLCLVCLERHRGYNHRRSDEKVTTHHRRVREGICVRCGERPVDEGRVQCDVCLERRRQSMRDAQDAKYGVPPGAPLVDRLKYRLKVSDRLNLSNEDSRKVVEAIETLYAYASAIERQGVAQGSITRLRKQYDIESIVGTPS